MNLNMKMLKFAKYWIIIIISIFLVFIFSLFFLSFWQRQANKKLALEYDSFRVAITLIENWLETGTLQQEDLDKNILGFGIYNQNRQALFLAGDAPQFLRQKESVIYKKNYITFVMPFLKPLHTKMKMKPKNKSRFEERFERRIPHKAIIMIKYRIGLLNNYFMLDIYLYSILLVLLLAMIFAIYYLFRKNLEYKAREAKNSQLISLGEAARTLAHEIKNPLATIKVQKELIKKYLTMDQQNPLTMQNKLKILDTEVQRISLLTDNIADFLKNPVGKPENINISDFLIDLTGKLFYKFEIKDYTNRKTLIPFDQERLRSVLENLLKNAYESNLENNNHDLPIDIQLYEKKEMVEIKITDKGTGINDNDKERVLDLFYTTKVKGSGIGLSIANNFIKAQGGNLELQNNKSGGLTVIIKLPKV